MKVRTSIDHSSHEFTIEIIPETTVDREALEQAGTQTEAKVKKNGTLQVTIALKAQAIGRADVIRTGEQ